MQPSEFYPYLEELLIGYAADHVRGGRWTQEESLAKARAEVTQLLPDGLATANHFLFNIVAGPPDENVGMVWVALEPRGGFIYDLMVYEPFRRRGYAEEAIRLAEQVAREKGADKISLHVFGSNIGARKLYTKLGYSETNVLMSKSLTP